MLRQFDETLQIATSGPGAYEFTRDAQKLVRASAIKTGIMNLLVQHTSASLTIQENADPDVQVDLMDALDR